MSHPAARGRKLHFFAPLTHSGLREALDLVSHSTFFAFVRRLPSGAVFAVTPLAAITKGWVPFRCKKEEEFRWPIGISNHKVASFLCFFLPKSSTKKQKRVLTDTINIYLVH